MTDLHNRLRLAVEAFRDTLADADLRRAQLAFGAIWASEWAFTVALAVAAFRDGGAAAVGLVGSLRMAPVALLGPLGAALADRCSRRRVLVVAGVARGLLIGMGALVLAAGGPTPLVYALAALATAVFAVVRPAHSALLPTLCATPVQLTSATVVRGLMDSLATLVGPALSAAGLAVAGPAAVCAGVAIASGWSSLLMAGVRSTPPGRAGSAGRVAREVAEGFASLVRHRDAGVIVGLALVQTFTRGCLAVLTVIVAVDVIHAGEAGVGVLTSAIGVGAVAGSLGAGLLTGGGALARWEGIGVALWGVPLIAIAMLPKPMVAVAALATVGIGNALVDVGLFSLPSRLLPGELLGRVFGVFESLVGLTVVLGSLAAPAAVSAIGIHGALVAIGLVAPSCVAAAWPALRRIDGRITARDAAIAQMRAAPGLRRLSLSALDKLVGPAEGV